MPPARTISQPKTLLLKVRRTAGHGTLYGYRPGRLCARSTEVCPVKVIFLQDVPPIGHAGDVKEVKDGYGRNYLVPRKLAAAATRDALARVETLRAAAQDRRARETADWGTVAEALKDKPVVIKMRAGPAGRLYGSVTTAAVAQKLAEIAGRAVDRRGVRLPAPVREVGKSKVHVRLHEGIELDLDLVVEPETPEGENAQAG